jgi:DNA (cytosine-5)-methyltransferase 1
MPPSDRDDLTFDCSRIDVESMLGNAVPSALAEVLAREIRRQLQADDNDPGPLKLIPALQRPIPGPEPLQAVPAEYRKLIGDHPDHPGEGRLSGKPKKERAQQRLDDAQPTCCRQPSNPGQLR